MESIRLDLALAVRSLWKSRGFSVVAILTFALGIGATASIYSLVHGVLLSPLGYANEERLVGISSVNRAESLSTRGNFLPDFWHWREHAESLDAIAFHGWRSWNLADGDRVERVESVAVSSNLFQVLGLEPAIGRNFLPEDETPGAGRVVLVSHALWQRVWGGDESIVGRSVQLDGEPVTVVGVMPAGTDVPSTRAELWRPVGYLEQFESSPYGREERDFEVIGRLAPGTNLEQARGELARLSEVLAEDFPATNAGWEARVLSLGEHVSGSARVPLLVALASVVLVLVMACSNLANLLLVRASGRGREASLRVALGAGRRRLMQQHVVESLVLTALGGLFGVGLAYAATELLLVLEPGTMPRKEAVGVGAPAAWVTALVAIVASALFGLATTLRDGSSLAAALKDGGAASVGPSRAQGRLRAVLVGGQIALALSLVASAGLLARTLHTLSSVDPGFEPRGAYSSHIILGRAYRRDMDARRRYFKEIVERVEAIPGVQSAALSTAPPVPGLGIQIEVPFRGLDGPLPTEPLAPRAAFRVLGPGYFRTVGTPLLAGRDFDERDGDDAPPVVIVNETLARRAYPNEAAVGKPLSTHQYGRLQQYEIVGVAADTRFAGLDRAPRPALFVPHEQMPFLGAGVVARTDLGPASFSEAVRRAALELDPSQPVMRVDSLEAALAASLARERFYSALLVTFAALAMALAASGVYGVFAYWVGQRRREMGLRIALGARSGDVVGLVLSQGLRVLAPSLMAGVLLAVGLSRWLSGAFESVPSGDAATLSAAAAALVLVALTASLVPARDACRVSPTETLRSD